MNLSLRLVSIFAIAMLASACNKAEKTKSSGKEPATAGAPDPAKPMSEVEKAGAPEKLPPVAAAKPTEMGTTAGENTAPAATANKASEADKRRVGDAMVAMFEEFIAAAESNNGDCDKTAASMKIIIDKNKSLMTEAKSLDADPETEKWFKKNYGPRMMKATEKLTPVMMACKDNKNMAAAFGSMR